MRNKIFSIAAAVSIFSAAWAGSSSATVINPASLQNVLNGITQAPTPGVSSVNAGTDYIPDSQDSYWSVTGAGGSLATFIIELAGFANSNTFGIYDRLGGEQVQVFSGAQTSGAQTLISIKDDGSVFKNFADTGVDFNKNSFGFYITTPQNGGKTYYSDTSMNSDLFDHMVAYQGTGDTVKLPGLAPGTWTSNEYILAFEDLYGGGDKDFDDMVLMMESIETPEPGTIILLGSGLIGFAFYRRRMK